jgi:hypothetical protein
MRNRSCILAIVILSLLSGTQVFAQKSDKKEDVPITLALLEKCMYLNIDSVEKLLAPCGFLANDNAKQLELIKNKWKPNRYQLYSRGKVDLVIVYSTSGVFHFTLSSESTKEKIGEELLAQSFKAGYKEITHEGENPKVSRSGKKEVKYDSVNKPWTLDLNEKK